MRIPPLQPPVPRTAGETVRQAILALLQGEPVSALEISAAVRIREKEVYDHLEHIRRTLHPAGGGLLVTPAGCRKCGYLFTKRDRLTPPGKCPVCRHSAISGPLFALRRGG
jgi:predicted Zn-ribbon and HTH transcriptional regulator